MSSLLQTPGGLAGVLGVFAVAWVCILRYLRASRGWELEPSALARPLRWCAWVLAALVPSALLVLTVEVVAPVVPGQLLVVLLVLSDGLAGGLLLVGVGCLGWALAVLVRGWTQRSCWRDADILPEHATHLGQAYADTGHTEADLLSEIARILQAQGWPSSNAEADRFKLLACAAYQGRWRELHPDDEDHVWYF